MFFPYLLSLFLAVDKLGINLKQEELVSERIQSCLDQWQRVVIFYSLRLMLAPVIETIVQLDRLLYLAEEGKIKRTDQYIFVFLKAKYIHTFLFETQAGMAVFFHYSTADYPQEIMLSFVLNLISN